MAAAMDDQQGGILSGGIAVPVQFLQSWLPGFVRTVTAARKIDELIGMSTVGNWHDEEIVQGVLEPIGGAKTYGDFTNIPLSNWNVEFVRRSVHRGEHGIQVGVLEEARAGAVRIASATEKRNAATMALEIQRNGIGFNGFNNGANRTYGFLNTPELPAYDNAASNAANTSATWAYKTYNEILHDVVSAMQRLQNQSQGLVDPESTAITLAIATSCHQYLISTVSQYGKSVRETLSEIYPKLRIVSAPQLNAANGGASVFYLYAEGIEDGSSDGGDTWMQLVPSKFMLVGAEKKAKMYVEDYSNATAGVMCKRPYLVVRVSGVG